MCINTLKQKTELFCKEYDQSNTESNKINMDIEKLCSRWIEKLIENYDSASVCIFPGLTKQYKMYGSHG